MKNTNAFDWVALILVVIGGINWGLVGAFNFDLVAMIFGTMSVLSRIVYVLIGLGAIYTIFTASKMSQPMERTHAVR